MDKEALRELAEDLAMNHEYCPKDVILNASDAILNLLAEIQSITEECTAWRTTAESADAELVNARKQMESQKDEWLSWEAKRSDLERDAGRYRWLRLPDSDVPISGEAARDSVFYDAAIDYAMREEK